MCPREKTSNANCKCTLNRLLIIGTLFIKPPTYNFSYVSQINVETFLNRGKSSFKYFEVF